MTLHVILLNKKVPEMFILKQLSLAHNLVNKDRFNRDKVEKEEME